MPRFPFAVVLALMLPRAWTRAPLGRRRCRAPSPGTTAATPPRRWSRAFSRFLDRELAASVEQRQAHWKRDLHAEGL